MGDNIFRIGLGLGLELGLELGLGMVRWGTTSSGCNKGEMQYFRNMKKKGGGSHFRELAKKVEGSRLMDMVRVGNIFRTCPASPWNANPLFLT